MMEAKKNNHDPLSADIEDNVSHNKDNTQEASTEDQISDINQKYDELQAQFETVKEQATRAYAEIQNIRHRAELDIANSRTFALEKFIVALLPVLDSLEHAVDKSKEPGIEMIFNMMSDIFKSFGVTEIYPEAQLFNPHEHEAIAIEHIKEKPDKSILTILQRGYRLQQRVIRPARVIVNKLEAQ